VSHLPASVLASAARRMKKGVIADLNATGEANAAFTVKSDPSSSSPVIAGGGAVRDLRVTSKLIQPEIAVGEIKSAFDRDDRKPVARKGRKPQVAAAPTTLRITSTPLPMG